MYIHIENEIYLYNPALGWGNLLEWGVKRFGKIRTPVEERQSYLQGKRQRPLGFAVSSWVTRLRGAQPWWLCEGLAALGLSVPCGSVFSKLCLNRYRMYVNYLSHGSIITWIRILSKGTKSWVKHLSPTFHRIFSHCLPRFVVVYTTTVNLKQAETRWFVEAFAALAAETTASVGDTIGGRILHINHTNGSGCTPEN